MLPRQLVLSLAILGVVLTATVVTGPFTIDENNHLVSVVSLRQGRLTLPGTAALPPSRELLFFDPTGSSREVTSTPVASTAPPLYAPLAVAFSYFGWRGLVAINTLALLGTVIIVFVLARRFSARAEAPWLAAVAAGAGSYFLEYGQGVWPHMLAVALVAGAAYLAAVALEERPVSWAAAGAGFLAATAAGVRYQNAFVLGCIGLGLLLLARRRLRAVSAFALGALVPLAASSVMNHARVGSWNPISKGPGYMPSPSRLAASGSFVGDTITMAWARIVDYTARPPLTGTSMETFLSPHPGSGAYVLMTAVKKAWLQSSPWMIVPLVVLVLAWLPAPAFARIAGAAPQRQLRMFSLIVIPTLGMFSASGIYRTDGACFNQRYFCELVPLMAIALAWSVPELARWRTAVLAGGLGGAVLALASLAPDHLSPLRHWLMMYVPLALAALLAAAWIVAALRGKWRQAVALAIGASLAWALAVHLGDDMKASRMLRRARRDYLAKVRPQIPDHSAIFASSGEKDSLGPLLLERDLVIATPLLDGAATTRELIDVFLAQGRRVFFVPNAVPVHLLNQVLAGRHLRNIGEPLFLIEVRDG